MAIIRNDKSSAYPDLAVVAIYAILVIAGWFNIHAAVYNPDAPEQIFSFATNSGKQLIWIGISIVFIAAILIVDFKIFSVLSFPFYGVVMVLLLVVLVIGKTVAGAKSWISIGAFALQPAEFAKLAVALALAQYFDQPGVKLSRIRDFIVVGAILAFPAMLILLQNDTGSAMVFVALVILLYRLGLNPFFPVVGVLIAALIVLALLLPKWPLIIGLTLVALVIIWFVRRKWRQIVLVGLGLLVVSGFVYSIDYFMNNVLQPHQSQRIVALINPDLDPLGAGWNITQSKIAIGSGGLWGKGFLKGTQTKFDFVPEQSTDFIFCTIAEEHGYMGVMLFFALYAILLIRIIVIAERQKTTFGLVYGYAVASFFFFHFFINIGMTIGLLPIIGIPLPFFSYGGSSLVSFTILLFVLLKLDIHRMQLLAR